jgi:hypothetical protein
VQTVKGYAAHESSVLTAVTEARASAMRATGVAERSAAEGALTGALGNLMAVAERYPDLKANQNFLKLQDELADLENKIAAARRFMNNAAAEDCAEREFRWLELSSFEARPRHAEVRASIASAYVPGLEARGRAPQDGGLGFGNNIMTQIPESDH